VAAHGKRNYGRIEELSQQVADAIPSDSAIVRSDSDEAI
jgi:hypothetical protein